MDRNFLIGMDVGSTTVKAVVIDAATDQIVWSDYHRHDTKQPEKVLEFLKRFETEIEGFEAKNSRMFITGSGGNGMAKFLGAKFVQEVNAVSLAVEKMYPECGSVIELGGQDAKIIIFKTDPETGRKKKIPSMNDKCAGGTGAVIDKINAKLRIPTEELCNMGYKGVKLHPVAGKCGVFAETDINGLQKMGVPPDQLMASLFEAIVMQNLSVLTRGNTLLPVVLLLGGPNCYIKGMRDCWKSNIPKIWQERNTPLPEGVPPEDLIKTPDNAQYFAAIGSVEFGKTEDDGVGQYIGFDKLEWYVTVGREEEKAKRGGGVGLAKDDADLAAFKAKYRTKKFTATTFQPGEMVEGFVGIDGGSTSTKAVLLSKDGERRILAKTYQLSKGNPIEDTIEVLQKLDAQIRDQGARVEYSGRRHYRLRQRHSQGCGRRGCGAGGDRGAYRSRSALLRRCGRDLRRGRAGYQDHHPEERPREGFQAQHAMLGGQRLLSAIHRAGLQRARGAVRGYGVRGDGIPIVWLWVRRVHAVRHRRFPAPGMEAGRDHGGAVQCAARRTSGCTCRRFRTFRRLARASCCRAARNTIWPP